MCVCVCVCVSSTSGVRSWMVLLALNGTEVMLCHSETPAKRLGMTGVDMYGWMTSCVCVCVFEGVSVLVL